MTKELEIKANAMLTELSNQRAILGDRCTALAAEISILLERIAELEKKPDQSVS